MTMTTRAIAVKQNTIGAILAKAAGFEVKEAIAEHAESGALTKEEKGILFFLNTGNDLKNFQLYDDANEVFAIILWSVLHSPKDFPSVCLTVETNDYEGSYIEEAYYDLLVINLADKEFNIPVPLLSAEALVSVFKKGVQFIPRKKHNRVFKEHDALEIERLVGEKQCFALQPEYRYRISKILA